MTQAVRSLIDGIKYASAGGGGGAGGGGSTGGGPTPGGGAGSGGTSGGGSTPDQTLVNAIAALSPLVWYRCNDSTSTMADNGSLNKPATISPYPGDVTQSVTSLAAQDTTYKATTFGGATSSAAAANNTGVNFAGATAFSVLCFINTSTAGTIKTIQSMSSGGWGYRINSSNNLEYFNVGGSAIGHGTKTLTDGVSHMSVITVTAGNVWTIYDDAVATATGTTAISASGGTAFNTCSDNGSNLFKGTIQHICIFGYTLSQGQINILYNIFKNGSGNAIAGLPIDQQILSLVPLTWYKLNDTTSTVIDYGLLNYPQTWTTYGDVTQTQASLAASDSVGHSTLDNGLTNATASTGSGVAISGPFTLYALIKTSTTGTKRWISSLGTGGWVWGVNDTNGLFAGQAPSTQVFSGPTNICDNHVHAVAVVQDSSTHWIGYVDNTVDITQTSATSTNAGGANYYLAGDASHFWNGNIQHVCVFGYALSQAQIYALYATFQNGSASSGPLAATVFPTSNVVNCISSTPGIGSTNFSVYPSGGTAPYTYSWSLITAYLNVTLLNTTTGLVTIQKTFTLNEVSSNTSTLKCVVTDATNTSVTVNATCQFVVTYGGNTFVTGISPSSQIKYGWSNYPGSTNATVLLTASGGVPPYTYQWSMVESFGGVSLLGGWGPAVELKKVWSQYETSYDTNIVQCVVKDSGGNSQTVTAKVTFSIYHLV